VRIRIVVNGPALTAVSTLAPDELSGNVGVSVCAIGLQRHNITETEVPDGVEIVPAAPLIIIEEQFNGAAYLRL
jgi:intracellular sulfur oxidation DsrE/DsrF family protein